MRNRLGLRYAVEGDARFISHHDSLRMFERALARAAIEVRYSQGFNPRPRIRIALPRPVGVASLDELLVVELTSPAAPSDVLANLSSQMPAGIAVLSAEGLADGDRRLPSEACYALDLEPTTSEPVAMHAAAFMSKARVEVARIVFKTQSTKTIDIRPYVLAVRIDDHRLRWTQAITAAGTARAEEVLEALKLPSRCYLHRLVREVVSYRP